jgi:hypothetical protein
VGKVTITASYNGASDAAKVEVAELPLPIGKLFVNNKDNEITVGLRDLALLTWSTKNTTSCVLTANGLTITDAKSGMIRPIEETTLFTLNCIDQDLNSMSDSVLVHLAPPKVISFTSTKKKNFYGTKATLMWNSANTDGCAIAPGYTNLPTQGSIATGALYGSSIFTLTCSYRGQTASSTLDINVQPPECGGTLIDGACWYLSQFGDNCTNTCATRGGYNEATDTYAGGHGTTENCGKVMTALGVFTGFGIGELTGNGYGCSAINLMEGPVVVRFIDSTDPDGRVDGMQRACACQQ